MLGIRDEEMMRKRRRRKKEGGREREKKSEKWRGRKKEGEERRIKRPISKETAEERERGSNAEIKKSKGEIIWEGNGERRE